ASVAEVAGPAGERLSATAAWALYPDDAESADDLVRVADRRLYAGKRGDAVADVDGEPWLRGERARVATRV
ncbi:MAG: hypothetical protein QOK31_2039, partial [Solirubrobacteraceae bacterium]|nr:hypothetical protein [Solirubrobacteraceae bacterium]